jgi:ferric-dicitrate binding protein FerR (iron transport regulator)
MTPSQRALEAWKHADADARAAESRLLAAWDLFEKQLIATPAEDLLRQVAQLRGVANEKLTQGLITLAAGLREN